MKEIFWIGVALVAGYFGLDYLGVIGGGAEAAAGAPVEAAAAIGVGFLAIGTLWFWLWSFIGLIVFFVLLSYDKDYWVSVAFVVFLFFLWLWGDVLAWVFAAWANFGWSIMWYFAVGTSYASAKVLRKQQKISARMEEFKREYQAANGLPVNVEDDIPASHIDQYNRALYDNGLLRVYKDSFTMNNKANMLQWGVYWPLYMTWDAIEIPARYLGRFIRRIFTTAFDLLMNGLGRIRDYFFRNIDKDIRY